MKFGRIAMLISGAYILSIKRYMLPNLNIFVPNLGLLDSNNDSKEGIIGYITNALTIKLDNLSWILSFKPINGIKIPYYVRLPLDAILSIPKIKSDIGKNIKIIPVGRFGVIIGYRIIINNVSFYA